MPRESSILIWREGAQCAKFRFEFELQVAFYNQMGKKQRTCQHRHTRSTKPIRHPHKPFPSTPTPTPSPSRPTPTRKSYHNQFNEADPIGLAKIFRIKKNAVCAALAKPPAEIRFREKEMVGVSSFVSELIRGELRGCRLLMVTGNPGQGKSMCVGAVLEQRQGQCQVIRINANNVRSFRDVQKIIAGNVLGYQQFGVTTQNLLCELAMRRIEKSIVVEIDGIDGLFNAHIDDSSSEFLSLFSCSGVNMGLIGIGGRVHELEKYMARVYYFKQAVRHIIFEPYSRQVITSLIRDKLNTISISSNFYFKISIKDETLQLAITKLLALTNDFRLIIDYLQKVILLKLEAFERTLPVYPEEDDYERWIFCIEDADLEIIKKVEVSKGALASSLPLVQQLILLSLSRTITAEDLLYLSQERALMESSLYLTKAAIGSNMEQIKSWLKEIENYGLIKTQKKGGKTRIMLMVGSEDLKWCMQAQEDSLCSLHARENPEIDNLC